MRADVCSVVNCFIGSLMRVTMRLGGYKIVLSSARLTMHSKNQKMGARRLVNAVSRTKALKILRTSLEKQIGLIDANTDLSDNTVIVNPKKNSPLPITKAIRLKPSVTDYATFVATTSKVLGTTGPAS